jgi:hypothetical protein
MGAQSVCHPDGNVMPKFAPLFGDRLFQSLAVFTICLDRSPSSIQKTDWRSRVHWLNDFRQK